MQTKEWSRVLSFAIETIAHEPLGLESNFVASNSLPGALNLPYNCPPVLFQRSLPVLGAFGSSAGSSLPSDPRQANRRAGLGWRLDFALYHLGYRAVL